MASILVIDDDHQNFRVGLEEALDHHSLRYAADAVSGLKELEDRGADLVLLDIRMPPTLAGDPDREGLICLEKILEGHPGMPVIMLSVFGDLETVVEAVRAGAWHYIPKPPDLEKLRVEVERAFERTRLQREVMGLRAALRVRDGLDFGRVSEREAGLPVLEPAISAPGNTRYGQLVGSSPEMLEVYRRIEKVAKTDLPVLVLGASGTGKELVARELHARSVRENGPFRAINCSAIPRELMESTLFGHVRGAFTGAGRARTGEFELAHRGVLLLDEIADLDTTLQPKLLRLLEDGTVQPVGSSESRQVDVRIISSTNRNILELVECGHFREDLFYRLNAVPLVLPPLCWRGDDVRLLAEHLLAAACARSGRDPLALSCDAMDKLKGYQWPGNVRELKHVIERAVALTDGDRLVAANIEFEPPELKAALATRRSSSGSHVAVRQITPGLVSEVLPPPPTRVPMAAMPPAPTGGDGGGDEEAVRVARELFDKACGGEPVGRDVTDFRNRHGSDILALLMRYAIAQEKDIGRAGRLLGFVYGEGKEADRTYVKFRKWARRLGVRKSEVTRSSPPPAVH